MTPEEWLEGLPEPRRAEVAQLDAVIRAAVPELARTVHSGMLGYGPYHYRYPSGRQGDTCVISLASNKRYISLYVNAVADSQYLAERYADRFPNASVGRSCIRIRHAASTKPRPGALDRPSDDGRAGPTARSCGGRSASGCHAHLALTGRRWACSARRVARPASRPA